MSAVASACSSSVRAGVAGARAKPLHRQVIRVVAVPVQQHVADVELVRLRRGLHVVGPAAGGVGVDGDRERPVGLDLHGAAVEHGDRAHVRRPTA